MGFRELLAEADAKVEAAGPDLLADQLADEELVLTDLRDIRELEREGKIPSAVHTPHAMLEL